MENSLALDLFAYLQVLIAFAVVIQSLLEDVHILDDIICKVVMQTIEGHNLPPLTGRCHHNRLMSPSPSIQPKWTRIECNYKWTEESVLSNWVHLVLRFPEKQFERTFQIKRQMFDIILNHLAGKN